MAQFFIDLADQAFVRMVRQGNAPTVGAGMVSPEQISVFECGRKIVLFPKDSNRREDFDGRGCFAADFGSEAWFTCP